MPTIRELRHNTKWLWTEMLITGGMIIYTYLVSPDSLKTEVLFFLLFGTAIYALVKFLFLHTRHALLLSAGSVVLLILRAAGLRSILYPILIIAIIGSLELLLTETMRRKE